MAELQASQSLKLARPTTSLSLGRERPPFEDTQLRSPLAAGPKVAHGPGLRGGGAAEELYPSRDSRRRDREPGPALPHRSSASAPRPSPGGTQAGRRRGVRGGEEVAASALARSSRGPTNPRSEDVAPHCSSSRRKAVPPGHVSEQASRRGSAGGARGQRDLQVSARAVGTERGRAGSGGQ